MAEFKNEGKYKNSGMGMTRFIEDTMTKIYRSFRNLCLDKAGAAAGSATAKVKTANAIDYLINGVYYQLNATDDFVDLTGFDVTDGKTNKCLLCVDSSGDDQIVVGTEASTAAGVTIPAIPASYAVFAILTVTMDGGDFTGGTTGLDDGNVDSYSLSDVAFVSDNITG